MAGRRDRGRGAGFCLLARAIRGTMDEAGARMLLDVLSAGRGVVCAVGAGGKKSTLYRLAEAHRLAGSARVAFTATVMVAAPPASLFGEPLIGQGEDLAQQLRTPSRSGVWSPMPGPRRSPAASAVSRPNGWRTCMRGTGSPPPWSRRMAPACG